MISFTTMRSSRAKLAWPAVSCPVRMLFFVECPHEVGQIRPWDVIMCRQATDAVRTALAPIATRAYPYATLQSDLTQRHAALWGAISRQRQQKIKQADALDVEVREHPFTPDELYDRIAGFHAQKALPVPSRSYVDSLRPHSDTFLVTARGQEGVLHLVMKDPGARVMVMYSCVLAGEALSNSERGTMNSYLHWWEMCHYQQLGYASYDWGGVVRERESPAYGITRFKQEFGGALHEQWHLVLLGSVLRPFGRLLPWKEADE
jgi:hypothetical protein